jgi:MFS transporter, PAT family, beta-lactamase induction signal transducer AmpG
MTNGATYTPVRIVCNGLRAHGYLQNRRPFRKIKVRWRPLLLLDLADGVVGSLFTLSLIMLPHTPLTFAAALVGEYLFQAVAFSIQVGVMFETIGENNPLAATIFTVLSAATYVPITYMMIADGSGYSLGRIAGSFGTDAAISIAACAVVGFLLYRLTGNSFHLGPVAADALNPAVED